MTHGLGLGETSSNGIVHRGVGMRDKVEGARLGMAASMQINHVEEALKPRELRHAPPVKRVTEPQ